MLLGTGPDKTCWLWEEMSWLSWLHNGSWQDLLFMEGDVLTLAVTQRVLTRPAGYGRRCLDSVVTQSVLTRPAGYGRRCLDSRGYTTGPDKTCWLWREMSWLSWLHNGTWQDLLVMEGDILTLVVTQQVLTRLAVYGRRYLDSRGYTTGPDKTCWLWEEMSWLSWLQNGSWQDPLVMKKMSRLAWLQNEFGQDPLVMEGDVWLWLSDDGNDHVTVTVWPWLSLCDHSRDHVNVTAWLDEWLDEWLAEWLAEWLVKWLAEWVDEWLAEWLAEWLDEWRAEWLTE